MVVTKRIISEIVETRKLKINNELELYLLQEYGSEPFPYEWEEENLWHHIPKTINDYWSGSIQVRLKSPFELISGEHEHLQSMYMDRLNEISTLNDHLRNLERIIMENNLEIPNEEIDF